MISKALGVFIWLLVIPFCVGLIPAFMNEKGSRTKVPYILASGYVMMWAVFQLVTVPLVLKADSFTQVERLFEGIISAAALAGVMMVLWQYRKGTSRVTLQVQITKEKMIQFCLWGIFALTVLFQLYMSYSMAYADGDDAYYLPISSAANLGGSMYQVDSYTGAPTTLDMRHGLAPFPIWISFIASKCAVNAAVAAQTLIPLVLIPVTYCIYMEIGRILCGKHLKTLPIFMLFVSLLQIFGNYSIYPASTFLLTRTRQGKAALGNIIIPFLLLLLLQIAKEIKESGKAAWKSVLLLLAASFAGCLCSTMSTFLISMLVMLAVGLMALLYKNWRVLVTGFVCCIPCAAYALLYFRLK